MQPIPSEVLLVSQVFAIFWMVVVGSILISRAMVGASLPLLREDVPAMETFACDCPVVFVQHCHWWDRILLLNDDRKVLPGDDRSCAGVQHRQFSNRYRPLRQ